MNSLQQRICLWCAPVFLLLVGVGFAGLPGFLPPPSPDLTAEAVAKLYGDHAVRIKAGMLLCLAASGLVVPFAAVLAQQMRRMPGCDAALASTQLVAGAATSLLVCFPSLILACAAYRPGRSPELTQLLNDLGWFTFIFPFPLVTIQALAVGLAILLTRQAQSVFPRWSGYLNLWFAFLAVPGGIGMFFKSGPFAWDGVFVFWIPLTAYFLWYAMTFLLLRGAIARQPQSDAAGADSLTS